jgi:hypothetical protein
MTAMRRIARQRGSLGGPGFPLLVFGILLVWSLHAAGLPWWVAPIALAPLLWLAYRTGALPSLDAWLRARRAARLATDVGGTVEQEEHAIWGGGTAIAHVVRWKHYSLCFDVTGVQFGATAPHDLRQASFDTFNGSLDVEGAGEALLDAASREAIREIEQTGAARKLSFDARGKLARLYKHDPLNLRQALRLVRLGTPVLERALAELKA